MITETNFLNIAFAFSFFFRMAAIKNLNPKAEIARNHQALAINIAAARGLRDVMKTNLGPKVKIQNQTFFLPKIGFLETKLMANFRVQ